MGGKHATRGIVLQIMITILESLKMSDWDSISVEPETEKDKVDVIYYQNGAIVKAVQVKSSINKFEAPPIIRWTDMLIGDIVAPEYTLILVGEVNSKGIGLLGTFKHAELEKKGFNKSSVQKIQHNRSTVSITQQSLDKDELWDMLLLCLLRCINDLDIKDEISTIDLENIADKIIGEISRSAKDGTKYTKESFIRCIKHIVERTVHSEKYFIRSVGKRIIQFIVILAYLMLLLYAIKEGWFEFLCLLSTGICFCTILFLLRKSDSEFNKCLEDQPYESYTYKDNKEIDVHITKSNTTSVQKVIIKNKQMTRIVSIRGELDFYRDGLRVNHINFLKYNIDAGKEEIISEVNAKKDWNYHEKTYWNEVHMNLIEMVDEDGSKYSWEGVIVWFFFTHYVVLNYFNYWNILGKRIPYEITWLRDKIRTITSIATSILRTKRLCYGKISVGTKIKCWILVRIREVVVIASMLLGVAFVALSALGAIYLLMELYQIIDRIV